MPIASHEFPDGFAEWLEPLFEGRRRFVEGMSEAERWVAASVVEAFVRDGRGPTCADLARTGVHPAAAVEEALAHLDRRDLLVVEGERVLALYPFSNRRGRHRVEVAGKRLDAM